jgi:hypothetical protein
MCFAAITLAWVAFATESVAQTVVPAGTRVKAFLDCSTSDCHDEYLREDVDFVEYVRDRSDADVHVLITSAETGARGREFTLGFIGLGRFASVVRTLTATFEASDSEDRVRSELATALTVGLLSYVAPDSIPAGLAVEANLIGGVVPGASPTDDGWNRWIFSLNGNGSLEAEESTRELEWGLSIGADRITPEWKLTFGASLEHAREEFDLDEEQPLSVERRNRSLNWLTVRSLGEHWSIGATGEFRSSTFDNISLDARAAPAIEWNFFPYSMYTRRQLRVLYAIGGSFTRYYEETLFFKTEETRAGQRLSTTYEQREPWGTLEGRVEWSNYFPGLSTHRLGVDGEVDLRIARGLSLSLEASASRIRDQLSLPRRDATPEEVLLRLRQLSSDFEMRLEFGITYQFGSRFASIVNPRFGQ